MKSFDLKFRMEAVQHSCAHGDEAEPLHDPTMSTAIKEFAASCEGCEYVGSINGKANSYQLNLNLDDQLLRKLGWKTLKLELRGELGKLPNVMPDAVFDYQGCQILLEVEKANKKTIWFDLIKMPMLIRNGSAKYGFLVVPRNYSHSHGVWNLFDEARFYRYCFCHFAGVPPEWLSKIAIVGYTQHIHVSGLWKVFGYQEFKLVKSNARDYFSGRENLRGAL